MKHTNVKFKETGPAFTLVELLVVIAIIGILAALIMTVVSRSRNKASQVTDLNNLKQQMIALHSFANDNSDVLPWPNWDDGDNPRPGWLYTLDLSAVGLARYKVETGLFWNELHNPKIYFCPMDRPEAPLASKHYGGAVVSRRQQISSYVLNGAIIGYMQRLETPVKLATMNAADCAFWETDEMEPYYFNDGSSFPEEGVSRRHHQGGIQSTFDGAVNYVRFDIWYRDVEDPARNRLWCYPGSENGR